MPDHTVTPLRRPSTSGYSDTAALNDIHALLTRTDPGDGTLADIALILDRAGRPLVPIRDIEISATETALGRPVACVEAGDASVFVRQASNGTGLLVEICTKNATEHATLTVALDGTPLHVPHPEGCVTT